MRRSYQNLIEVKNRDEWENYKSILSISTVGVFETKDVVCIVSCQLVRRVREVRESFSGQEQRCVFLLLES